MIKVLKAGFYTTIQDKGRIGFANIGVPISGVMDAKNADLANKILNNSLEDAVIEITFGACKLQFLSSTNICISGGDFSPTINEKQIPLNTRIAVYENDILSFGKINYGARCYLAVAGGFLSEIKLGSRSFYKNITQNYLLKKDDLLHIKKESKILSTTNTVVKTDHHHFKNIVLSCFKGPEFNLLTKEQQQKLLNNTFTISKENNRMGYRLHEALENNLPQILSSAVLPGTVQLTPSGKLIILMKDCQVTGGYCRVLQLSVDAIHILAQKTTGNTLQFKL